MRVCVFLCTLIDISSTSDSPGPDPPTLHCSESPHLVLGLGALSTAEHLLIAAWTLNYVHLRHAGNVVLTSAPAVVLAGASHQVPFWVLWPILSTTSRTNVWSTCSRCHHVDVMVVLCEGWPLRGDYDFFWNQPATMHSTPNPPEIKPDKWIFAKYYWQKTSSSCLIIAQLGTNGNSIVIKISMPSKCVNFSVKYLHQYLK